MAKILDSNSITGVIQKVVETPLGYIINGHYYDKEKMIPKPLKVFPVLGDIEDLSMSKKLMLNHTRTINAKTAGETVITDRYDPTISYVFATGGRNNTHRLFKIKESNGDVNLINSNIYTGLPTSYPMIRSYCGQDTSFLYYIIETTTYGGYLVKIDKVSLTMTTIDTCGTYSWSNSLKETSTHIYHARKQRYGTVAIRRYNKLSTANEIIPVTAKTSTLDFGSCYSDNIDISETEFYNYGIYHNPSTNKFGITRYKFNTAENNLANICQEADPVITWGSLSQLPVFVANLYVRYEPFITKSENGKKYLNIAIYEINNTSTVANLSGYGIYTFLINPDDNTLLFKNFVQPTLDYFRGFLGVKNNTFLVCASTSSCIFMSFDQTTEKFVITDTLSNQPTHIGVDQGENIWIVNSIGEVEYLNPFVPTSINVKYELDAYKYEGVDINTYCNISCQNYSGNYITTNLKLTLKGNGVFTSTGNKTISVSSLSTGDLKIPIKLQGAGNLTIYPQMEL